MTATIQPLITPTISSTIPSDGEAVDPILAGDHPNLVCWFDMDDVIGDFIQDQSPNGLVADTSLGVTFVPGLVGNGLQANPNVASIPDNNLLTPPGDFTAVVWFERPVGISATEVILGKYVTQFNQREWAVNLTSSGAIQVIVDGDGTGTGQFVNVISSSTYDDGSPHMAILEFDAGVSLTVNMDNGADVVTDNTGIPASVFNGTSDLELGGFNGSNNKLSTGWLDNFRLFDRLLTADEKTSLYGEGTL